MLEPLTLAMAREAANVPNGEREKAEARLRGYDVAYRHWLASYDIILSPVLLQPPVTIGHIAGDVPVETLMQRVFDFADYTLLHNVVGAPAASVPLHWRPAAYRSACRSRRVPAESRRSSSSPTSSKPHDRGRAAGHPSSPGTTRDDDGRVAKLVRLGHESAATRHAAAESGRARERHRDGAGSDSHRGLRPFVHAARRKRWDDPLARELPRTAIARLSATPCYGRRGDAGRSVDEAVARRRPGASQYGRHRHTDVRRRPRHGNPWFGHRARRVSDAARSDRAHGRNRCDARVHAGGESGCHPGDGRLPRRLRRVHPRDDPQPCRVSPAAPAVGGADRRRAGTSRDGHDGSALGRVLLHSVLRAGGDVDDRDHGGTGDGPSRRHRQR